MDSEKNKNQRRVKRIVYSVIAGIWMLIFGVLLLHPLELRAIVNRDGAEEYSDIYDNNNVERSEEPSTASEPWNITDMDLTLQYDDRYSLDNIKKGWAVASIETKEVYANVNHFFTLLGKMFFTPYGKEFFTSLSKQIFTS